MYVLNYINYITDFGLDFQPRAEFDNYVGACVENEKLYLLTRYFRSI